MQPEGPPEETVESSIRPIARVLVANRGEIAVRIMQTCAEMGIETVAVYSAADARALHVQRADMAVCLGPAPALESYLNIDAILRAARDTGVDAIHPGYGFLAENPVFAARVVEAGLVWIGPPADVIARMGDKVASKQLAEAAGVPTVPGYMGDDMAVARFRVEADRIGYPVMLKAAAGGGGKGMRAVEGPDALEAALEGARREAHSAFGDDRVFLEKLLVRPRHIEIQVMLDAFGHGVYLGERECSIQRRHQKVIEESPSPVLTADLRDLMGRAALRLASAAGYVSAGTVEFLFDGDDAYFLEMNTRIQVEHPVTEMVTGLDLVRLQIEIACGKALPLSQLDVRCRGHAIETRLYAEDPSVGFLPATGTLQVFRPPAGPGVRNDVGVMPGAEISPYYDPIVAKLIVHAEDRAEAVRRLRLALQRYAVLGVTTNLSFLQWMCDRPEFIAARMDTSLVDRIWDGLPAEVPTEVLMAAAAYEQLSASAHGDGRRASPWQRAGGWRQGGVGQSYRYACGEGTVDVTVSRGPEGTLVVNAGGESRAVAARLVGASTVVLHAGEVVISAECVRRSDGLEVLWKGRTYLLERPELRVTAAGGGRGHASPTAPMPGTVVKVVVEEGQRVAAHEPLLVLEAMKMEHVIEAPHDGIVTRVLFGEGDLVPAGSPVVEMDEA